CGSTEGGIVAYRKVSRAPSRYRGVPPVYQRARLPSTDRVDFEVLAMARGSQRRAAMSHEPEDAEWGRRWRTWSVVTALMAACGPPGRAGLGDDAGDDAVGDGATSDPCAPANLGDSYIGCDYYPTVTGNTVGTLFDFAVAIANTSNEPAAISITGGALE